MQTEEKVTWGKRERAKHEKNGSIHIQGDAKAIAIYTHTHREHPAMVQHFSSCLINHVVFAFAVHFYCVRVCVTII